MKKRNESKLNKFVEKGYKISFRYLKESKNFIYFAIGVFFFFSFVGFFVQFPESFKIALLEYLREILRETEGFGVIEMVFFILGNNALSSFFGLFLGFLFGIFPFFNASLNGLILGFVSNISTSEVGFFSLWRLLPHGIFELPAIFISLGLGFKLSSFIFEKNKWDSLRDFLEKSFYTYIFVVLPLLVVAAIIEGILIVYF